MKNLNNVKIVRKNELIKESWLIGFSPSRYDISPRNVISKSGLVLGRDRLKYIYSPQ